MSEYSQVDALNGRYEEGCDLERLDDMLTCFNEYMAGGFGEDNFPEKWKPVFTELEEILSSDGIVPARLVNLW